LTAALKSRSIHVRWSAASALGEVGPAATTAVSDLVKALNDKAPVRTYATAALGKIAGNPKLAVPALISVLDEEDREVRLIPSSTTWATTCLVRAKSNIVSPGPGPLRFSASAAEMGIKGFRVGVQMHDSACRKFWSLK